MPKYRSTINILLNHQALNGPSGTIKREARAQRLASIKRAALNQKLRYCHHAAIYSLTGRRSNRRNHFSFHFSNCSPILVIAIRQYKRGLEKDQRVMTDKELLLLFEQEPDGILTKKRIIEKTNLTKAQAARRLQFLQYNGLLKYGYSNNFRYYYSLSDAIDKREPPVLSKEPFLTVEDILKLFKHFNYRLTLQNLCIATGLPIQIIKRELKYFEKEKIISSINSMGDPSGISPKKTFTLREPYRSNPDAFLQMENLINPELEKIYEKLFV